jgi:hypothetical protein
MRRADEERKSNKALLTRGAVLEAASQDCRHCGGIAAVHIPSRLLFGYCQACGKLAQRRP